jgi:hypothetical protein
MILMGDYDYVIFRGKQKGQAAIQTVLWIRDKSLEESDKLLDQKLGSSRSVEEHDCAQKRNDRPYWQ